MSVEKVNKYKEEKAHRKENIARQKRRAKAARIGVTVGGIVVVCLIVGAIGLTFYNQYTVRLANTPDYSAESMLVADVTGILTSENEEDETGEDAEAEEADEAGEDTEAEEADEAGEDVEADETDGYFETETENAG